MFTHQMEVGRFCDVTLACEGGQTLKAHRSVLGACSGYFNSVLSDATSGKDTLVIIKDSKFVDIQLLLTFMYTGVVSVDEVSYDLKEFVTDFFKPGICDFSVNCRVF